jgi:hypothetical protein
MNDSIVSKIDTLLVSHEAENALVSTSSNWLIYLLIGVIIVLLLILFFIISNIKMKHSREYQAKQRILREDQIDWNNTMYVFKAQELYNQLKVVCHPDRFTDPQLKAVATDLFQRITKNKTNYKELQKLKEEAKQMLSVNI